MRQVAWIALAAMVAAGCGQEQSSTPMATKTAPAPMATATTPAPVTTETTPAPVATETTPAPVATETAPVLSIAPAPPPQPEDQTVYVLMTTSKGDIVLALDAEKAPTTVANFVEYTNNEFYDGTIFHRVMGTFMIQGGGFTQDMQKKQTRDPIANEWQNGLKNGRGTIAMARIKDPNSATAQFFINVVDNPALDEPRSGGAGYAVFGEVVAGMDVVDTIKVVDTGMKKNMSDVPIELVVIERVRVISADEARKLIEAGA